MRQVRPWRFIAVLILVGCHYPLSSSFVVPTKVGKVPRTRLHVNNREQTLYEILGASPNDSQRLLKSRYTELAKQFHPDANGGDGDSGKFAQIAAAYGVLGDPKERLRYDRILKAKEFTNNVESLMDVGFKNAVPFFRKTADTTLAAVETSSKTMQDVGERAIRAKERFELDQKCRDLEQQASSQFSRAKKIMSQSKDINGKRHKTLSSSDFTLTSSEARRLLDRFVSVDKKIDPKQQTTKTPVTQELASLEKVEAEYKTKQRQQQGLERDVERAQKNAESALKAQELAQLRLEQAQRDLARANKEIESCETTKSKAISEEKQATVEMDKAFESLERQREKVRTVLAKKESETLQNEAAYLKQESERAEQEAKELQKQARELRIQSKKMTDEHRKLDINDKNDTRAS